MVSTIFFCCAQCVRSLTYAESYPKGVNAVTLDANPHVVGLVLKDSVDNHNFDKHSGEGGR